MTTTATDWDAALGDVLAALRSFADLAQIITGGTAHVNAQASDTFPLSAYATVAIDGQDFTLEVSGRRRDSVISLAADLSDESGHVLAETAERLVADDSALSEELRWFVKDLGQFTQQALTLLPRTAEPVPEQWPEGQPDASGPARRGPVHLAPLSVTLHRRRRFGGRIRWQFQVLSETGRVLAVSPAVRTQQEALDLLETFAAIRHGVVHGAIDLKVVVDD